MTATLAPTRTNPVTTAVLTIAANRRDLAGHDWDTIRDGFGPVMDDIANDLAVADQYEAGLRDHEVRTRAAAEHETRRLRERAADQAAFVVETLAAAVSS